jgi:hypothetical protein
MTKMFKTQFYYLINTVEFTLRWQDEDEYRSAKAFLDKLTGGSFGKVKSDPDHPDYYVIETAEQREALYDFRRGLRDRRGAS